MFSRNRDDGIEFLGLIFDLKVTEISSIDTGIGVYSCIVLWSQFGFHLYNISHFMPCVWQHDLTE